MHKRASVAPKGCSLSRSTLEEHSVPPSVTAVYKGPRVPETEFEELKLPDRFWGAYHRLIISYGEIYYCATVELIGLYEESDPEIIYSYLVPLEGNFDFYIKGGFRFNGWKDHSTFEISTNKSFQVRIYRNGKFSLINN
jgi:hypothetical protein